MLDLLTTASLWIEQSLIFTVLVLFAATMDIIFNEVFIAVTVKQHFDIFDEIIRIDQKSLNLC